MILSLLLLLAPYTDIHAKLDLPIPMCVPELFGVNGNRPLTYPEDHPLVFHFADEPVRLIVASSCRGERWICLYWNVQCDSECVWATGGRTARKDEVGEDAILFAAPLRCWGMTDQVTCRIAYWPSSLGDMDGDCETTPLDFQILVRAKNWNRLRVFADVQNEWSGL